MIANIERAWTGRRVEDLYEVTHSALGASRTAGAEQLAAILSELQAAIKSSAWTETDALQARLAPAFARVKDAIERLVPVEASRDER